eukprot:5490282-Pyramimonas_sp.AAC.1
MSETGVDLTVSLTLVLGSVRMLYFLMSEKTGFSAFGYPDIWEGWRNRHLLRCLCGILHATRVASCISSATGISSRFRELNEGFCIAALLVSLVLATTEHHTWFAGSPSGVKYELPFMWMTMLLGRLPALAFYTRVRESLHQGENVTVRTIIG